MINFQNITWDNSWAVRQTLMEKDVGMYKGPKFISNTRLDILNQCLDELKELGKDNPELAGLARIMEAALG